MKVAVAQIEPVLLDREATLERVAGAVSDAAGRGARLVVFGEATVPGYPYWASYTNAALFGSELQAQLHRLYIRSAVSIPDHLTALLTLSQAAKIAIVLGVVERAADRGYTSLYCSCVTIDRGEILSVHRKLMPTYEERLSWGVGDGAGLVCHPLDEFKLSALNCWENWMPLARAAMYAQGATLHAAIWPGSRHNTEDITRFIAIEGRLFVASGSNIFSRESIPLTVPGAKQWRENAPLSMANGGACIAAPDGSWVLEPQTEGVGVFVQELDFDRVLEARHNFDVSGHYSRPDVLSLEVNRSRQRAVRFRD